MALIPCKECGKEISSNAVTCPFCGATKKRIVTRRKPSQTKSYRILYILGISLLWIVTASTLFVLKGGLEPSLPKPVVVTSSIDDAKSSFTKYRVTIHATVQNQGGEGNIKVVFIATQSGQDYKQEQVIQLTHKEIRDVAATFEEVRMIRGNVTHRVEVIAL